MDPANDMDPVLRSLGADLERDDPALAALLSGRRDHPHRHSLAWLLLALPLLLPALLLPARVTLGLLAMLLILASPLMVCWLCAATDDPATGHP
jgi:hypothetical protein